MLKLISVDLQADFGFFRKPDANATINLSYNIIHKPALLGLLGAVIGLKGYEEKNKTPEYFEKLSHLKVGIEPLCHDKGNFQKTIIKYSNTVGYANKNSTFLTEEATLIKPVFRIYLLLDSDNLIEGSLLSNLENGKAEFIPYFGKNEFYAWWDISSFKEYSFSQATNTGNSIIVKGIFIKRDSINNQKDQIEVDIMSFIDEEPPFIYMERLPEDFDFKLFQYNISEFVFTTFRIKNTIKISNLYYLEEVDSYVQLI